MKSIFIPRNFSTAYTRHRIEEIHHLIINLSFARRRAKANNKRIGKTSSLSETFMSVSSMLMTSIYGSFLVAWWAKGSFFTRWFDKPGRKALCFVFFPSIGCGKEIPECLTFSWKKTGTNYVLSVYVCASAGVQSSAHMRICLPCGRSGMGSSVLIDRRRMIIPPAPRQSSPLAICTLRYFSTSHSQVSLFRKP